MSTLINRRTQANLRSVLRSPSCGLQSSIRVMPRRPVPLSSNRPTAATLPSWIIDRGCQTDRDAAAREGLSAPTGATTSYLTIDEVATALRVSTRTVRRLIASGRMTCMRVGRSVRIPRSAIEV